MVARRSLSDAERVDWLRLARTENVGPVTFRELLARYRTAAAALEALPELARRGGRRAPLRVPPPGAARREIDAAGRAGGRLIALVEPAYPPLLAHITDPPPLLYALGHAHLLGADAVGVVGARNASAAGIRFAGRLAADLGAGGLVVVSGLARGIDAAAHEGALPSGTVAVMAGGVDVVYPADNQGLYERIREAGALISEQPLGTVPQGRHFPRRNRLISGLSLGVVVVEATPRSGSLITARFAGEQGREVFAVPGSPLDPRARGANQLIRQGAVLTEGARDVIEVLAGRRRAPMEEGAEMPFAAAGPVTEDAGALAAGRAAVVEKLGPTPVAVDELIRQCQVTAAIVQLVLLELELAGQLDRHPGNQVSVRM